MDTSPPLLTRKNLFYRHAATFCLCSPFIAIVWNVFLISGQKVHSSDPQADAIADLLLAAFFPVLGILAGIIALFGIRRNGREGILWKVVFGFSIFLLMTLLAIPNFLKAKEHARERYEQQYGRPAP